MRRVNEMAATVVTGSARSSESGGRRTLDARSLDYLWRWMAEQYGSRWTSQYGAEPCQSWATTLAGLNGPELRQGVEAVAANGSGWPPTAPEFRALCRTPRDDGAAMAARLPASRALPEPEDVRQARRERGQAGLDACFAALGRARKP